MKNTKGKRTLRESMDRREAYYPEEVLLNGYSEGGMTTARKGGRLKRNEGGLSEAKRGGRMRRDEGGSAMMERSEGGRTAARRGRRMYRDEGGRATAKRGGTPRQHKSWGGFLNTLGKIGSTAGNIVSSAAPFLPLLLNEGGRATAKRGRRITRDEGGPAMMERSEGGRTAARRGRRMYRDEGGTAMSRGGSASRCGVRLKRAAGAVAKIRKDQY